MIFINLLLVDKKLRYLVAEIALDGFYDWNIKKLRESDLFMDVPLQIEICQNNAS
ncbi:hypothetical protein [Clostridium folliculivorans]|uniref:Uncharacterized protein n=1 Tax=Clostridium folliculivorans TaxID=2886038 RepID=A0A9W5Y1K4_9CLOT|nr:hypothetical protein [Clostridium folliculivorans]GKU25011.1 hypothetical protein CFOLD11_18370 [Clostridium folliculivorans]GKU31109.1 hypothetical protein CFB3_32160 [Clostridium folliculivorans]